MASIVGYTKAKIDTMLALLAPLASPVFTGNPTAPTPIAGDNDASIATTAFVVLSFAPKASPVFTGNPTAPTPSPGDNDTSIATTAFVTAAITAGAFAPLASPALTGNPTAPTPSPGDNDTSIATTAFVTASFAPLASPTFTGNPLAPTPAQSDNDTSIATTAFVQTEKLKVINAQSGTAYTLVLTDKDKVIEASNAAAITITVPPNSSVAFPIGTVIDLLWVAAGKPSFAAGAGVTINGPGGLLAPRVQWSTATIRKRATDTWVVSGDLV